MLARCILVGFVAMACLGCRHANSTPAVVAATCERSDLTAYRATGKRLTGDVDADGAPDRVTLRVDAKRPARCRYLLVAELAAEATAVARVTPLAWPGTDPQLLLLAEIDGRPGLESVVAMSPVAVYRPGAIFTLRRSGLVRMRLDRAPVAGLFPFYDEFPAGVDCAGQPGAIVVTQSRIAARGDRYWDVTRSFYRAAGVRFALTRNVRLEVEAGDEARRRWPEVRGDPFLRCPDRVN